MFVNRSESITEIAVALAKFQGEVDNPINTAVNPFFGSNYAPLDTILSTVRPVLSKHGLSIVQIPGSVENNITVTTILFHESGEYLESEPLVLRMDKMTAQGAGSAITYARRYALSAILGVASEDDDDGNAAAYGGATSSADLSEEEIKLETVVELATSKSLMGDMSAIIEDRYSKQDSSLLTTEELDDLIAYLEEV